MKKLLGIVTLILLWSNLSYAECRDKPLPSSSSDTLCTWNQIVSGETSKCIIDDNYFTYAITCEFEEYEKKGGDLSFNKVRKILEQAKRKQNFKSFFNFTGSEDDEAKEKRKYAEYECSVMAGKSNNSFSAKQVYKKCLAYKGYD